MDNFDTWFKQQVLEGFLYKADEDVVRYTWEHVVRKQEEYIQLCESEMKTLWLAEQLKNLQLEAEIELANQPESEWVTKLRQELMHSKMTHNFTFSRDEVIELLGGKFKLLGEIK